ncbi:hypothetical protein GQ457_05G014550 [Hibiscus cannabinus]
MVRVVTRLILLSWIRIIAWGGNQSALIGKAKHVALRINDRNANMHPGSTSKVGSSGIRVGKGVRRMLRLGLKYELEELVSRGNDKEALGVRGIEEDDPGDFRVLRMVNGMDARGAGDGVRKNRIDAGMTLRRLA